MRPDFDTLDLPPDPPSNGPDVIVFYDCEFTDLTSDSDLLSIGFTASESDDELYIELADSNLKLASSFVRTEVLPLFGQHNPQRLTRLIAPFVISEWLDTLRDGDRQRQIVMVSDSQWDWQHFGELFPSPSEGRPSWSAGFNLVGRMVYMMLDSGRQHQAFEEAQEMYFRQNKGRHHALVDARALRAAWWESRFS